LIEIPFSIAKKLAKLIPFDLLPQTDIILRVEGLRFAVPSSMLVYAVRNLEHVVVDRAYTKLASFEPCEHDRVLDVGAALGFYSILAAKRGAYVVAVEPQPSLAKYALLNAYLNRVNVRLLQIAVSPRPEVEQVTLYVSRNPLTTSLYPSHAEVHGGISGILTAKSIDFCKLLALLGPFTLIKIDAECIELDLLKQCHTIRRVPKLVIEVHLDCVDTSEVCALLEERGFKTAVFLDPEEPYQAIVYATTS